MGILSFAGKAATALGLGGAAVGGLAGGIGGAMSEEGSAASGAITGGGIGLAGGAAIGGIGTLGAYGAGVGAYRAAVGIGSNAYGAAVGVGQFAGRGAGAIGEAIAQVSLAPNNLRNPLARSMFDPVGRLSKTARAMGGLVKYTPETATWNAAKEKMVTSGGNYRLSGAGKGALGVVGAAYGFMDAVNTFEDSRKGAAATEVTTATPSMVPNAGATGDLVFAMHKNRRG